MPAGSAGSLRVDGIEDPLNLTVRGSDGAGGLHLEFNLDMGAQAAVQRSIDALEMRRAG